MLGTDEQSDDMEAIPLTAVSDRSDHFSFNLSDQTDRGA